MKRKKQKVATLAEEQSRRFWEQERSKPLGPVVGLKKPEKFRDKRKILGEVDFPDHARVMLYTVNTKRGQVKNTAFPVWVKLTKGTRETGQGIIDQELPEGSSFHPATVRGNQLRYVKLRNSVKLKLGDVIKFDWIKNQRVSVFTSKVRVKNQVVSLKQDLLDDLKNSMMFRPEQKSLAAPEEKQKLEVITSDQAAKHFAITNMALGHWLQNREGFTFVGKADCLLWRPRDGHEIDRGFGAIIGGVLETNEQEMALETERERFHKMLGESKKEYEKWCYEYRVTYSLVIK